MVKKEEKRPELDEFQKRDARILADRMLHPYTYLHTGLNPEKYNPDYAKRAYELCRQCGMSDSQLGLAFGVRFEVIKTWMAANPEFEDAVQRGRYHHDTKKVANSLAKRARGYNYLKKSWKPNWVEKKTKDGKVKKVLGTPKMILSELRQEHVPGDVLAQIFWLTNRNNDDWKHYSQLKFLDEGSVLDISNKLEEALAKKKKVIDQAVKVVSEAEEPKGGNEDEIVH